MRPAPGAAPASPSAARELRQDPDAAARARTRPLARASAGAAARGRAMGADRRHPGSARDARARARGGGAGGGGARGPRAGAGNGEPPGVARRVGASGAARGGPGDSRAGRPDRAGRASGADAPPPLAAATALLVRKRAIAARLTTGGEPFVAALDALDAVATRVRDATVLDKGAHGEWQEALRSAARRLEAAWLALEAVVAEEERRWSPELESLERWRPSLWPLLILWTPVAAALVWLGLALGGYVPAPAWLATRLGF